MTGYCDVWGCHRHPACEGAIMEKIERDTHELWKARLGEAIEKAGGNSITVLQQPLKYAMREISVENDKYNMISKWVVLDHTPFVVVGDDCMAIWDDIKGEVITVTHD
jgi:hypothetical protein